MGSPPEASRDSKHQHWWALQAEKAWKAAPMLEFVRSCSLDAAKRNRGVVRVRQGIFQFPSPRNTLRFFRATRYKIRNAMGVAICHSMFFSKATFND